MKINHIRNIIEIIISIFLCIFFGCLGGYLLNTLHSDSSIFIVLHAIGIFVSIMASLLFLIYFFACIIFGWEETNEQ